MFTVWVLHKDGFSLTTIRTGQQAKIMYEASIMLPNTLVVAIYEGNRMVVIEKHPEIHRARGYVPK